MDTSSLPYYLDRYALGILSSQEWDVLRQLLLDPAHSHLLEVCMDDQLKGFEQVEPGYDMITEEVLSVVLYKIQEEKKNGLSTAEVKSADNGLPSIDVDAQVRSSGTVMAPAHRVRLLKTVWFRYAASILLLLGVTIYFLWISNKKNERLTAESLIHTDIPPGRQGALLTLADGTKVLLDSLENGVVAHQNGSVVTLQNGMLAYDPVETANGTVVYNTISTPNARMFHLVLPDGSKVWLNSASSIKYPTVFSGKERVVEIDGEAYFEISKNAAAPFKVKVNETTEVEVLGTSFNINSYKNEEEIKTTLIDGSVKINAHRQSQLLAPRQQAVLSSQQQLLVINDADVDKAIAWRNGIFNFDDAGLREVMRQLERWYDIEVVYEKNVPDVDFYGMIDRKVSLLTIINTLQQSGVHFRMEGRKLIVLP